MPVAVQVATYDGNGSRTLLDAGTATSVSLGFTLPFDLTQTTGDYYLIVQTDSRSVLSEAAGAVTVAATGPIHLTLPLLPDLAVSNVEGPSQVIADPASITVSWTVTNNGQGDGKVGQWNDEVILTPDAAPGTSDDIVVGTFAHAGLLDPGASYTQTETILLPPALTGHFHLFVEADAQNKVFEYGNKADSVASKPGFLDVMPVAYSDLVVTNVGVPSQALGGLPLTVTWTVANQGIGTTSDGEWNDFVYLSTTPNGSGTIAGTLTSFDHFGFLAVGGSYQATQAVLVPNGLSGNIYVVVTTAGGTGNPYIPNPTGGPFEFIHTDNDTTVSSLIPFAQPDTPDLVVSSVQAPTTAEEGTPIDITWTVSNQGLGTANGAWVDRVYLQDLGSNPNNLIGPIIELGQYTTTGPLASGTSYTRTVQITLPGHIEDLYTVYVTTNYAGSDVSNPTIFEGLDGTPPTANDTTAAPGPIAIGPQPRPDLQVADIKIPSSIPAGSALSVTFDVINQGTVATNVPHWDDRVYLSLDTTIDPGSILIGDLSNQSALGPGQEYESTTGSIVSPDRYRGQVYVIVSIDYQHQVDQRRLNGQFGSGSPRRFLSIPCPCLTW